MKILLTGKPGAGKSTCVQRVVAQLQRPVVGVVGREIRNADHVRVGFEAVAFSGQTRVFAHVHDIRSEHVVGNKYHVDLAAITDFVIPEITQSHSEDAVVVIDEIGRMQAFSPQFLQTVEDLLNGPHDILATIVMDPEPWSLVFKQHPDVILVELDEENREAVADALVAVYTHVPELQELSQRQQKEFLKILRVYWEKRQYIQIGKLFTNALVYVREGRVKPEKQSGKTRIFTLQGKTDPHRVQQSGKTFTCDCPLFCGKTPYEGQAGECSHIQSVKLWLAQED